MPQKYTAPYSVVDLVEPEFQLLDTIRHDDLYGFIREAFEKRHFPFYFMATFQLLFVGVLFFLMLKDVVQGYFRFSEEFMYFSYGLLSTVLLIAPHELIHGLAYRLVGAKKVSYEAHWRKFYFTAMADRFVVGSRAFRIVALAPFVVVTCICMVLLCILAGMWVYFILGILLTHTFFCSGDFGLLNYLETHRDKEVYTYDDQAARISYFYQRLKSE